MSVKAEYDYIIDVLGEEEYFDFLEVATLASEGCQRNWDLSEPLTTKQKKLILLAAKKCPTKQNGEYYSIIYTEDRDIIEQIYDLTWFEKDKAWDGNSAKVRKNPQVLAQMLVCIVENKDYYVRNEEYASGDNKAIERDKDMAVGLAAGHISLMASLLGLSSGCCRCIDNKHRVMSILDTDKKPALLIGVGREDLSRDRRRHHYTDELIGSIFKDIKVIER